MNRAYVVSALRRTSVVVLVAAPLLAQTLEFDVATIKPNNTGSTRSGTFTSPGRLEGTNLSLHQMIVDAYTVRDFQVIGGPDWITRDRFDVIGKIPGSAPPNSSREMLKSLLADRFNLVVHNETREEPVYELRLARADRSLGSALKTADCDAGPCGDTNTNESSAGGVVTARGVTMAEVSRWVSNRVDRVVIDRTGLTGAYDFEMRYARDILRTGSAAAADLPTVFTALQEQLGLKLEGARGPVEFLVIDRAERPLPD